MYKINGREINKENITNKDKQYILNNELYLTSYMIHLLMPVCLNTASKMASEIMGYMQENKYFIPKTRTKLVNTQIFRDLYRV